MYLFYMITHLCIYVFSTDTMTQSEDDMVYFPINRRVIERSSYDAMYGSCLLTEVDIFVMNRVHIVRNK
ncbi:hypothetical protein HI914_02135 [Erysiphe necator]|nr:hypothetical protein HI914_02135 [Erysiphe necator]